jgi:hypothetical protein
MYANTIYIHTYVRTYITYIHIHTHPHTHIHPHPHTHTHTHTHTSLDSVLFVTYIVTDTKAHRTNKNNINNEV